MSKKETRGEIHYIARDNLTAEFECSAEVDDMIICAAKLLALAGQKEGKGKAWGRLRETAHRLERRYEREDANP